MLNIRNVEKKASGSEIFHKKYGTKNIIVLPPPKKKSS